MLAFHARRTPSPELAADLTAETFAAALAGAERFDPARGEPVQWLFGIARHLLARALERGHADDQRAPAPGMRRIDLDDEMLARIEELASPRVPAGALERAVDELPPDQRAAVRARVIEDRTTRRLRVTPARRRRPRAGGCRAGLRRCARS